jgi:DNA-binding NtrC family response regulator
LLSVLQTHTFRRIGGNGNVDVDLRMIATTNRNLEEDVAAGRFREDLFYHLNVLPLRIPPLREHEDDVHDLLNFYIDYMVSNEHLPYRHFSVAAQNRLRSYAWPGNIRELKNLVQRLLILGTGEEIAWTRLITPSVPSKRLHKIDRYLPFPMTFRYVRRGAV